jgi:hypothetical protein
MYIYTHIAKCKDMHAKITSMEGFHPPRPPWMIIQILFTNAFQSSGSLEDG